MKGGYFYRPHAKGYTSELYDAGRWTLKAAQEITGGVDGITINHISKFVNKR